MDGDRFLQLLCDSLEYWLAGESGEAPQFADAEERQFFRDRLEDQVLHRANSRPTRLDIAAFRRIAQLVTANAGLDDSIAAQFNELLDCIGNAKDGGCQAFEQFAAMGLPLRLQAVCFLLALHGERLDFCGKFLGQHPVGNSPTSQLLAQVCLATAMQHGNNELFLLLGRHGARIGFNVAWILNTRMSWTLHSSEFISQALRTCGLQEDEGEWMPSLAKLMPFMSIDDLQAFLSVPRQFHYGGRYSARCNLVAFCVTEPAKLELLIDQGFNVKRYLAKETFEGHWNHSCSFSWLIRDATLDVHEEYDYANIVRILEILRGAGVEMDLLLEQSPQYKPLKGNETYNVFHDLCLAFHRLNDLTHQQIEQRFRQTLELLRYLKDCGVEVGGTNRHGNNILHYVVEQHNLPDELVLDYVRLGISPWQRDADGDSPYSIARKQYFPELAQAMLELWPMPEDYSEEPRGRNEVERASRKESSADLYKLLKDPQKLAQLSGRDLHRAACIAIIRNKPSHLSLLLQAGAADYDLDPDEMDPLRLADPEHYFMGLHHEHPFEHQYSLLAIALACSNEACVAMLLNQGADPNGGLSWNERNACWIGTPPLAFLGVWDKQHVTVDKELMECARLMHAAGAHFNFILSNRHARSYSELRPMLQFWVELYSVGEVEELIRLGADPAQTAIANPDGEHSLVSRWNYMRGLCWHTGASAELVALLAASASREELIGALEACLHEDSADKLAVLLDNLGPGLEDWALVNLTRLAVGQLAAACLALLLQRGSQAELSIDAVPELICAAMFKDPWFKLPLSQESTD